MIEPHPGYDRGTVTVVRSPDHVVYEMGGLRWEWFAEERAAGRCWSPVERPTLPAGPGARGQEDEYEEQPPPAPPPPAPTSAADDQAAEIQRLADLNASGALTDEEFAAAKAKILGI